LNCPVFSGFSGLFFHPVQSTRLDFFWRDRQWVVPHGCHIQFLTLDQAKKNGIPTLFATKWQGATTLAAHMLPQCLCAPKKACNVCQMPPDAPNFDVVQCQKQLSRLLSSGLDWTIFHPCPTTIFFQSSGLVDNF